MLDEGQHGYPPINATALGRELNVEPIADPSPRLIPEHESEQDVRRTLGDVLEPGRGELDAGGPKEP